MGTKKVKPNEAGSAGAKGERGAPYKKWGARGGNNNANKKKTITEKKRKKGFRTGQHKGKEDPESMFIWTLLPDGEEGSPRGDETTKGRAKRPDPSNRTEKGETFGRKIKNQSRAFYGGGARQEFQG